MHVALVSSFPAFPTTAGNRSRIRQLALSIRELGHELTFIYLESPWESADDAAHEAAFGKGRFIRIRKSLRVAKWARAVMAGGAKRILRAAGVEAAYYSRLDRFRDRHFMARLAQLDLQPDIVLVEYVLDSWAFEAFAPGARRVLDTHDAFADRHKSYVARGVRDFWVSLRPSSENAGLRRAHVVLAIQQEEAKRFRRQLASDPAPEDPEVAVVGHLLEFTETAVDYERDDSAVFLASDNPANRHAIQHFIAHVLPEVVREIPAFDLKLAGSICGAVGEGPNLTKLGWVDDLRSVFVQAPISVNPMLAGTGINIKLLDAMACGVPTVATETGARGVPEFMRDGMRVVPDLDAQGFARALVVFSKDAPLRREVGLAARQNALAWHGEQVAALARCLCGS